MSVEPLRSYAAIAICSAPCHVATCDQPYTIIPTIIPAVIPKLLSHPYCDEVPLVQKNTEMSDGRYLSTSRIPAKMPRNIRSLLVIKLTKNNIILITLGIGRCLFL